MKSLKAVIVGSSALLLLGCAEQDRTTFEVKYGQQLPKSIWGDANNVHFDVKYEFDYRGKHFAFTHPRRRSTESEQGSIEKRVGDHMVSTYSQWVEMNIPSVETVHLIKNELGERFCVGTHSDCFYDVQTGEVLSEMRSIETLDIGAKLCAPEKQSSEYRRALGLKKKYPMPEHMID